MAKILTEAIYKLNKLIILFFSFFVFSTVFPLSLEEKIGQLFIIPLCEWGDKEHFDDLKKIISSGRAGGILLKGGTVGGQIALIEELQTLSPIPLLCLQDGEWGVHMRLVDAPPFPRNLTLGAITNLSLLHRFGEALGKECIKVGAHINLAPVVDVNNNPLNPIIHMRSFGDNPSEVAQRGMAVMRGMQAQGIYACAKHFPGHGNTSIDSHQDLPVIDTSLKELQEVELLPFLRLIQSGVKAIMTAHISVPCLAGGPVTFSPEIVTTLLQEKMGFSGLIITDALNMSALSKYHTASEIAIKALLAGHDLLLYGDHIAPKIDQILRSDLPASFAAIKSAVERGEIPEALIDKRIDKILRAKKELGLFEKKVRVDFPFDLSLKKQLFEEAITLINDEENILPIGQEKIVLIHWGETPVFDTFFSGQSFDLKDPRLLEKFSSKAILVLANFTNRPPHFGIGAEEEKIMRSLAEREIVAVVFGTPYSLALLPHFASVVMAYERSDDAQDAAAKVLLGKAPARGKLPISVINRI